MAIDIAELGLRVRSDGVVVAAKNLDDLGKAANDAESATERLQRQAEKAGKSMKKMGKSMSLYVTAPLVAAATASVKLGTEFGSTLAKMNTLVGVSRKELVAFRKDILALSPEVGRGPRELAEALFAITSAGQRGTQAMDTLKKAAMASAVGLGETRTIALAATAAVQAYGEANMDSTKALEILIGTIEQGNLEASSLAPVLGRVIGQAAELGVKFEDLGAFIAVFTRLGVNAEEAATSLRGVLAAIQKPTPESIEAFERLGTSIGEVRRRIKDEGFITVFQEIINKSREMGVDIISIVPNIRALSGALGVFGGDAKLAIEVTEAVGAAVGTLGDRYKAVEELDPSHQINKMRAELDTLLITMSQDLLPLFLMVVNAIKDAAAAFNSLDESTQRTVVKIGMWVAAAGPLLILLGSLSNVFALLLPYMVRFAALIYARVIPAMVTWAATMGGTFGIVSLISLLSMGLATLAIAMRDTAREATELDLKIEELIRTAEQFGMTQFEIAIQEVNSAIEENDALIDRYNQQLQTLVDLQQIPGGQTDAMQNQINETAAKIRELTAEGEHLRAQLERLGNAQETLAYKTALANGELEEISVTASRRSANIADVVKLTDDEATALAALVDELDPVAAESRDVAKAQALLVKALQAGVKNGGISFETYKKLAFALATSTQAYRDAYDAAMRLNKVSFTTQTELDDNFAYIESLEEMREQVEAIEEAYDPAIAQTRALAEAYQAVSDAFESGAIDEEMFYRVSEAIDRAADSLYGVGAVMQEIGSQWIPALRDMAGMFDRDSQEAKDLHRVITALNVVMGIHAVIKQLAEGDVYSAIPRAIGVAAMVASMGVTTGASGAARQSLQERRQEAQGTGSILGDAEAKTESIINAMEITASATSELVGINRGMLRALQALQAGLVGATRSVARGGSFDPAMPDTSLDGAEWALGGVGWIGGMILGPLGALIGGVLGWALGKLLGGKAKVIDRGVAILSGNLQDAIDGSLVEAFATIKYKKWRWGSSKRREELAPLADEATTQIGLIFQAIADTVFEGALALGMSAEEIEKAMATFTIAEQRISLEGLTAEEQQQELEAVFGEIFDDLARHVIPWIAEFQQVGEGLGETLVRVATSVQVFQEAVKTLGFAANEVDPRAFAMMAVGLVELVGGIEEFITKFTSFFQAFAPDEAKFAFFEDQLTRALEGVGLVLPETRDGMWELMQSLDATTEAGQAQIAMLLEIADVADEYYKMAEDAERDRLQQIEEYNAWLAEQRDILDDFLNVGYAPLRQLEADFEAAMDAARALGASTREVSMIMSMFSLQMQRLEAQTRLSVINLADQLFGEDRGDPIEEGLQETREVANRVFDEWMRALEDIYEFTQDILLNEALTTLTPAEQLAEAQRQFNSVLRAARAGDVEAAAALPDAADALLEEARFMYASGAEYQRIFDATLAALKSIQKPAGIEPTITEVIDVNIDYRRQGQEIGRSVGQELERLLQALDLVEGLRHLSEVTGRSIFDLADELNIPLREWMEALGIDLDNLTSETVLELANIATALGVGFQDLIAALDIGMGQVISLIDIDVTQKWTKILAEAERWADLLGVSIKEILKAIDVKPSFRNTREKRKYYDRYKKPYTKDPYNPYKKGYATGGYVSQSGMAMVHAGEFVIDKNQNTIAPSGEGELSAAELAQIRNVLVDIREQNRRYQEADLETTREISSGVKLQAEQTRRIGNG